MDFVDLIRLDGAVQVSGGVAGGPHAAFADDAAERTLGRIVYRRGETSEVMASIDLEFSSKHYDAPWDFWGWGSDITFFGLHQGWAVSLLGWLLEFRLSHHCTTGLDRAPFPLLPSLLAPARRPSPWRWRANPTQERNRPWC